MEGEKHSPESCCARCRTCSARANRLERGCSALARRLEAQAMREVYVGGTGRPATSRALDASPPHVELQAQSISRRSALSTNER